MINIDDIERILSEQDHLYNEVIFVLLKWLDIFGTNKYYNRINCIELSTDKKSLDVCYETLSNPEIGSVDYMDGSQIYSDFRNAADIARKARGTI